MTNHHMLHITKNVQIYISIIFIAVIFSFFFTMMTARICVGVTTRGLFTKLICGNLASSEKVSFKKLNRDNVIVLSNISESKASIVNNQGAKNLIDGSLDTMANPGSKELDYSINLLDKYDIKQIRIQWGDYGIGKDYIEHWQLESSDDNEHWSMVEQGGLPLADHTLISKSISTSMLRLRAQSNKNWIGIYEVEIIARPS